MQSKKEIFEELNRNRAALARFGISRYGLFGSFVREEQNEESDIDILVDFKPDEKTFDNFMNLAFYLEGLLGREVDLVTRESLSPHIGPKILTEVEYGIID
ncbi:MAG: nucleotidyltransferase family protein [Pyrinomonadaceae bacterium]